jgi:hypothetical protein
MRFFPCLIGIALMALANGRLAAAEPPLEKRTLLPAEKKFSPAVALIREGLVQADKLTDTSEQLVLFHKTMDQVAKAAAANLVVHEAIASGREKANAADPASAAKRLRKALLEAEALLSFQITEEAPLPDGFPEPTPVGEIRVKRYPACRLARVDRPERERAFWTLFGHIQKKEIAMTAPVEMTMQEPKKDEPPEMAAMAFLYRTVKQGTAGKDGDVNVIDVAAMDTVSIGLRGDMAEDKGTKGRALLENWLKDNADRYEAAGPMRVMGYNSPFLPAARRYVEVEIPVREKKRDE